MSRPAPDKTQERHRKSRSKKADKHTPGESSAHAKTQLFQSNPVIASLVFDSLATNYESAAMYTRFGITCKSNKQILDKHMQPLDQDRYSASPLGKDGDMPLPKDDDMPFFMQDLHNPRSAPTQFFREIMRPLLFPLSIKGETQMAWVVRRTESYRLAYIRMKLVYVHEAALVVIFELLLELRMDNHFLDAIETMTPELRSPILSDILTWMEKHERSSVVQESGLRILRLLSKRAAHLFSRNAPLFWACVARNMILFKDDDAMLLAIFDAVFQSPLPGVRYPCVMDTISTYHADLATAVAVTTACCDVMESCYGVFVVVDGIASVVDRIYTVQHTCCLLHQVWTWKIPAYWETPQFLQALAMLSRASYYWCNNLDVQKIVLDHMQILEPLNVQLLSKHKIFHPVIDHMSRRLKTQKFEDTQDEHNNFCTLFRIITTWTAAKTKHDAADILYFVNFAVTMFSYLMHRYMYSDEGDDLQHRLVQNMRRLLHNLEPEDIGTPQQSLLDLDIIPMAIHAMFRAYTKGSTGNSVAWMQFLEVLVTDHAACQKKALQSDVMQMLRVIAGNTKKAFKAHRLHAVMLASVFVSESFDEIPDHVDLRFVFAAMHCMIQNTVPFCALVQWVAMCASLQKQGRLDATSTGQWVITLLMVITNATNTLLQKTSHIPKISEIQKDVIAILAQIATDDHAMINYDRGFIRDMHFTFMQNSSFHADPTHIANMAIVTAYFRVL